MAVCADLPPDITTPRPLSKEFAMDVRAAVAFSAGKPLEITTVQL